MPSSERWARIKADPELLRAHRARHAAYAREKRGHQARGERPTGVDLCRQAAQADTDACILWTRAALPSGEGLVLHKGKTIYARRLAFALYLGQEVDGCIWLRASCKNNRCVNPRHMVPQATRPRAVRKEKPRAQDG